MFDSARIRQKLQQLKQLDPNLRVFGAAEHRYQLRACLDEAALLAFEAQHGVTLPEDYRAFLREVGDGGPGPHYGLYSLAESLDGPWLELGPLQEPFPLSCFSETTELSDDQVRRGCLLIENMGCGYFVLLIVSGDDRGDIWYDYTSAQDGFKPAKCGFLAWYEGWLDNQIAELSAKATARQQELRAREAELVQRPDDPRPRVELAELLRQDNEAPERVRALMEEAAALGGQDVRIWNHLCALARAHSDWKQLAELAQKGLEAARAQPELPLSARARFSYYLGVALSLQHRFAEATEQLAAALANKLFACEPAGGYLDVRTYLGWSLRHLGRYEEARLQLIAAPDSGASGAFVHRELGFVHRELGFVHAELGLLDKAAMHYGKVCDIHRKSRDLPALAAALCAQAAVQVRRGDEEAARRLYQEALSHVPDHAEASRGLAGR